MRSWVALVMTVACGPMYASPQSSQPPPQPQQGPPGGGGDDPTSNMMADTARIEPVGAPQAGPMQPPPMPADKPSAPQAQKSDAQLVVDAHNAARAKHCAAPLAWSDKLAKVAQSWANSLRDHNCAFEHSHGQYGENLAAGTTGYMDPNAVVAMWYDEVKDYDWKNPGFSMNTGHFTQVVWKGTTSVGCGKVSCNNLDVWVCNYDPAGNWDGQYKENVLPTSCAKR